VKTRHSKTARRTMSPHGSLGEVTTRRTLPNHNTRHEQHGYLNVPPSVARHRDWTVPPKFISIPSPNVDIEITPRLHILELYTYTADHVWNAHPRTASLHLPNRYCRPLKPSFRCGAKRAHRTREVESRFAGCAAARGASCIDTHAVRGCRYSLKPNVIEADLCLKNWFNHGIADGQAAFANIVLDLDEQ
jgi:hypothetical protein